MSLHIMKMALVTRRKNDIQVAINEGISSVMGYSESGLSWLSNPTSSNYTNVRLSSFCIFAPEVYKSSSVPNDVQFYTLSLICSQGSKTKPAMVLSCKKEKAKQVLNGIWWQIHYFKKNLDADFVHNLKVLQYCVFM